MKCVICKNGETSKSSTTITLERGNSTVIFKKVPCLTCEQCGEVYLDEGVSEKLYNQAEKAVNMASEVNIQNFDAA